MDSKETTSIEEVHREAANYTKKNKSTEFVQLIIFKLGTEEYAMEIDQIKEVVITPKIAKVPRTPTYIKGIANIRGNIIAIMDLEERFGIGESTGNNQLANYTLVIESDEFKIGFLVKEVPNTLSVALEEIDSFSEVIRYSEVDEKCIKGIVKHGQKMIFMIDVYQLLILDETIKSL